MFFNRCLLKVVCLWSIIVFVVCSSCFASDSVFVWSSDDTTSLINADVSSNNSLNLESG